METIELWKCEECMCPCYTSQKSDFNCNNSRWGGDVITATIQGGNDLAEPQLKFGDEVEAYEDGWQKATYISRSSKDIHYWVKFECYTDPRQVPIRDIRLPIKSRLKKGQPLIVNGGLRLFSHFDDGCMFVFADVGEWQKANYWRLLTREELKSIGHKGWLCEEDVE